MEVILNKQPAESNFKKSTSSAFIKGLRRINEVGKSAFIHIKINSLKRRIRDMKTQIGDYVLHHQSKFSDDDFISGLFTRIDTYNHKISIQKNALKSIKKDFNSLNNSKLEK